MGFSVRLRGRLRLPALSACVGVPVAIVLLSGCSAGGEACTLSGNASFSPGLTTTKRPVSYTFTGTFSNCKSAGGDASIKSGSVSASGSGPKVGCAGGNTSGTATINWNNGQSSTISITTAGALNAVEVSGTVTSGEFAGHAVHAVLAFTVTDPTQCTGAGVTNASFKGETTPA